jgi:hypothetical protein
MTQPALPTASSAAFESPAGSTPRDRAYLSWLRRLAREPFLHFTLLGALVFVGQRLITRAPEEAVIEVSVAKQRELSKLFEQRQRRAPSEVEQEQLIQRYVEDEVLFREGLRLSLVQTDPTLRAQVIARVRGMLQAEHAPTPPTDDELRRYYDEHRADYATPETISYREYWLQRGPDAGSDARRLLAALRAEKEPDEGLPNPSDHSGRSEAQLIALYDADITRSLWALPNGSWHELRSERGIHIVRIAGHTPAIERAFAEVREQVSTAYHKDQTARALHTEVARITAQWRVDVAEVGAEQ